MEIYAGCFLCLEKEAVELGHSQCSANERAVQSFREGNSPHLESDGWWIDAPAADLMLALQDEVSRLNRGFNLIDQGFEGEVPFAFEVEEDGDPESPDETLCEFTDRHAKLLVPRAALLSTLQSLPTGTPPGDGTETDAPTIWSAVLELNRRTVLR